MLRRAAAVGAAITGLLALSACGTETGTPRAALDRQTDDEATANVRLAVADVEPLGTVVTDQNGRTLYRFDRDAANPSVSNCGEDCARSWPPVIVEDPGEVRLADIDQGLVGMVNRPDGSKQLTLNGWPLYRYIEDSKAGDVNGQGVDGTWFASTPEGKKVQARQVPQVPQPDTGYGN